MFKPPLSLFRPEPCCARRTPTRASIWLKAVEILSDHLRSAAAALRRWRLRRTAETLEFDEATLRDLGLSHSAAAGTAHERTPVARHTPRAAHPDAHCRSLHWG